MAEEYHDFDRFETFYQDGIITMSMIFQIISKLIYYKFHGPEIKIAFLTSLLQ
jgi:hypothetical protein